MAAEMLRLKAKMESDNGKFSTVQWMKNRKHNDL